MLYLMPKQPADFQRKGRNVGVERIGTNRIPSKSIENQILVLLNVLKFKQIINSPSLAKLDVWKIYC